MHTTSTPTATLNAYIEGVAFWSPRLPGWELARAVIRGERVADDSVHARPAPTFLAPTERRRAPDTVVLALEAGEQACRHANRVPSELDSVFASTNGDVAISDYMCATLAASPELISPTKFHHSVHNAAAGYWSIGTGTHTAYTAMSAGEHTFATGLLEAIAQVNCGARPILLIAYDIEARGPLASQVHSRGLFAVALVLSAVNVQSRRAVAVEIQRSEQAVPSAGRSPAANLIEGSALATALPFFEALASSGSQSLDLPLSKHQVLRVALSAESDRGP